MALVHGGQLQMVAQQYDMPLDEWLDLSTGIAPLSYPVPAIPLCLWQQLPQKNEALIAVAKNYYQCDDILVTNGSQSIIKSLPALWQQNNKKSAQVFLPERGYQEHRQAWQKAGYQICYYQNDLPALTQLRQHCVLVVINPNNPTGKVFSREQLTRYQLAITALNGLLVVDEAFVDIAPTTQSICPLVNNDHTLVLRSFGKFFGLAGIRIGFLIASPYWQDIFSEFLGPWQVNGPAQFIAQQALADKKWQQKQQTHLAILRKKQETLMWQAFSENASSECCSGKSYITDIKGTDLFLTVSFTNKNSAKNLYHNLCLQGVYVRLSDEQDTLRFGIACAAEHTRLYDALLTSRALL